MKGSGHTKQGEGTDKTTGETPKVQRSTRLQVNTHFCAVHCMTSCMYAQEKAFSKTGLVEAIDQTSTSAETRIQVGTYKRSVVRFIAGHMYTTHRKELATLGKGK